MQKITTRSLIISVADRWHEQYKRRHNIPWYEGKEEIYNQLKRLDLYIVNKEIVDRIIGNDSWTSLRCHQCESSVDAVVQVGQPEDYDSATACLCEPCLKAALKLIKG